MIDIWDILEIEPTLEVSLIKKAYSKKLKIFHPEEDPKGYQKLREAYDRAIKYVKNCKVKEENKSAFIDDVLINENTKIPLIEEDYDNLPKYNSHIVKHYDDYVDKVVNTEEVVNKFFEKIEELYTDFFCRIEENNWRELLNDEVMWKFEYKEIINKRIIDFLIEHPNLPKNIWLLLNSNFHFNEQEEYLKSYYPEPFLLYLLKQIGCEKVPRYCYFTKTDKINYEEYLNYREEAFIALIYNDVKKAWHNLTLAYEIYKNDPDLLNMKGEYYIIIGDMKSAYMEFNAAKDINAKDTQIYFYQGQIMLNNNKFIEAVKIFGYLKTIIPKDFEVSTLLGICYLKNGSKFKASEQFLENLKINSDDIVTRMYLKEIANSFQKTIDKKHDCNLKIRRELRKIYMALDEIDNIKKIKITYKNIANILLKIMFYIVIVIGVIILAALAIGSGGSLIIVGLVIRFIYNSCKKSSIEI